MVFSPSVRGLQLLPVMPILQTSFATMHEDLAGQGSSRFASSLPLLIVEMWHTLCVHRGESDWVSAI
jgi:hypothetical protein